MTDEQFEQLMIEQKRQSRFAHATMRLTALFAEEAARSKNSGGSNLLHKIHEIKKGAYSV